MEKVILKEQKVKDHNLDSMRLWHPTRNTGLMPTDVSTGSHKRVWWQCDKGHSWQAKVYSVALNRGGCPYCKGLKPMAGENDLATLQPKAAKLWDTEKNGMLTPDQVTPGSKIKVWWKCEKGHSWKTAVFSVAQEGCGCPYCAGVKAIPGETDIATVAPKVVAQWDNEKNGDLDPRTILPSSHEKIWWKCELGHSWQAMPYSRTKEKGAGCPYCTGRKVLPGFNDLATLKPWLAEEWYQPMNGKLSPEDVTLGSNKKVWWHCREHHVWEAYIYARTKKNGTGCPVCAGVAKERKIFYMEETPTRKRAGTKKRKTAKTA